MGRETMSEYLERSGRQVMIPESLYKELLAYREGFSPAERMPEVGQVVRVEYAYSPYAPGNCDVSTVTSQRLARFTGASGEEFEDNLDSNVFIPLSWVRRWYPIGEVVP